MEKIRLTYSEIEKRAGILDELLTEGNLPHVRHTVLTYCRQIVYRKEFEPVTETKYIRSQLSVYWKHATVQKTRAAERAMNEKVLRAMRSTEPAIKHPGEGYVRF